MISIHQKDIDQLFIEKAILERGIKTLQNQLEISIIKLQKELHYKQEINPIHYYSDMSIFISCELNKQQEIKNNIYAQQEVLEKLSEQVTENYLEKKKKEHLLENIIYNEKLLAEKIENEIMDTIALRILEEDML